MINLSRGDLKKVLRALCAASSRTITFHFLIIDEYSSKEGFHNYDVEKVRKTCRNLCADPRDG